jgi:hypothetical protein
MDPKVLELLEIFIPLIVVGVGMVMIGWVASTWLRIKHRYPLEGAWGQAVYSKSDFESADHIRMLTAKNAELSAEVESLGNRLQTLERIATDQATRLARDIDALTIDKGGNA